MQSEEILFVTIALTIIVDFCVKRWLYKAAQTFIKNSIKAKAKIIAIETVRKGNEAYLKLLIIFTDQLGVEITSEVKENIVKNKYHEGEEVDIIYLKTDSKKVKMASYPKMVADLDKVLTFMLFALVAVLMVMLYKGMARVPFL